MVFREPKKESPPCWTSSTKSSRIYDGRLEKTGELRQAGELREQPEKGKAHRQQGREA